MSRRVSSYSPRVPPDWGVADRFPPFDVAQGAPSEIEGRRAAAAAAARVSRSPLRRATSQRDYMQQQTALTRWFRGCYSSQYPHPSSVYTSGLRVRTLGGKST